jgi:hypothetical protein
MCVYAYLYMYMGVWCVSMCACVHVCASHSLSLSLPLSLSLYVHAYVLGWGGVIVARQQEYLQESLKRLNASYSSTDSASVDRYVPQEREREGWCEIK